MHQPVLRYCDRGNEVARLQLMLREVDFTLDPDGIFGPMTREAVKTFQALHGIPGTGLACPMTWDLLEACQPVYPTAAEENLEPACSPSISTLWARPAAH